jgi:hypothetical protein
MEQTPEPRFSNGKDMLHALFQLRLEAKNRKKSPNSAKNPGKRW